MPHCKKLLPAIVILFTISLPSFAKSFSDTSGVYCTKTDFINDNLQFKSLHDVRITSLPFWRNFSLNTDVSTIKIKLSDGNKKKFSPGSFYGFRTSGIKFIYVKYLNEYLAVIHDRPPLYMFIRKKVHFSYLYAFADEKFYYSTNLGDSLKEFNVENIRNSFGSTSNTAKILIELFTKIEQQGLNSEMHKKQFFICKKLIAEYLSKINI